MEIDTMEELVREVYKILYKLHQIQPKFKGDGDLANVEFFMLIGISAMLDAKNGRLPQCQCTDSPFCNEKQPVKEQTEEQGVTLGEIIKVTGMSMSAASKKVSILEKKGLIERNASKTDRRNVYITLTEKGKTICEREKAKKHEGIGKLVERMGKEDLKQLLELANRALDIMNEVVNEQQKSNNGKAAKTK